MLFDSFLTLPILPDSGYASIIEDEDYVYVFYWEKPLEGSDDRPVARVARVCKTDPGINDPRLTIKVFSSFVKAQLICNSTLSASDTSTTKVYPFISERPTDVLCIGETKLSCTGTILTYLPSPLLSSLLSSPSPPLLPSLSLLLPSLITDAADVFRTNGTLDQETFSDMVYAVFQASRCHMH